MSHSAKSPKPKCRWCCLVSQALSGDLKSPGSHPSFALVVPQDPHTCYHLCTATQGQQYKTKLSGQGWLERTFHQFPSAQGHPNTCAASCTSPVQGGNSNTFAPGKGGLGWDEARVGQGVWWIFPHVRKGFPLSPHKQLHKVRNWHKTTEGAEAGG